MNERELIEAVGQSFRDIEKNLKAIRKINAEAGRDEAANAVFGLEGAVMVLHSQGTAELHKHWPDIAGEVQTLGIGR